MNKLNDFLDSLNNEDFLNAFCGLIGMQFTNFLYYDELKHYGKEEPVAKFVEISFNEVRRKAIARFGKDRTKEIIKNQVSILNSKRGQIKDTMRNFTDMMEDDD